MILTPSAAPARKPSLGGQVPSQSTGISDRYTKQAAIIQAAVATDPRLPASINFQIRNFGGQSPEQYEQIMESKHHALRVKQSMLTLREGLMWQYKSHFEAIVDNENNNIDFYNGYQWTDAELRDIQESGLTPHKFNYMTRWARTLMGEQRGAETMFQMSNHDPSGKEEADFWTEIVYRICKMERWSAKEAQNFFNYFVGGRSFTSVRRHPFDPTRRLKLAVHRPQEFIYDLDNAENGNLDGCKDLIRVYFRDVEELIQEHLAFETELRAYDHSRHQAGNLFDFTLATPKVHPTKKKLHLPAKLRPYADFRSHRSAWVTEHYHRDVRRIICVRDINAHVDYPFDDINQAAAFYRELRDARIYQLQAQGLNPNIPLVDIPREVVIPQVTKMLWCGDELLSVEQIKGENFPYQGLHCDFHQGTFHGHSEDDKDTQKMRNRFHVLIDMALSGVKGKTIYNETYFPKGTEAKDIETWLTTPTKALRVKMPRGTPLGDAVHHIPPPLLGEAIKAGIAATEQASNHINGGSEGAGIAGFAGQSARHAQSMVQRSAAGNIGLFSDFHEHGTYVAESMIQNAQHLTPNALLELTNPEHRERYMPIIENGFQNTTDMRHMIEVVEVMAGPTKREADLQLLKEVVLNDPTSGADILPEIVTLMGLHAPVQERINARRQAREDAQAEISKREQDRLDYEAEEKWRLAEQDREIKQDLNDIKRNPPVNTSLIYKGAPPGAATEASILEQNGISANPSLLHKDTIQRKLDDQDERDMMQEHANARTPEWQKKPSGSGVQGKSSGPRPVKDTIARKSKGPEKN